MWQLPLTERKVPQMFFLMILQLNYLLSLDQFKIHIGMVEKENILTTTGNVNASDIKDQNGLFELLSSITHQRNIV
jgi:hypothetical protein